MILGTGLDFVEIEQIRKISERNLNGFIQHVLTPEEREDFFRLENRRRKIEWLAGRFVAKEAASKAVGTGICKGVGFHDFRVFSDENGKPELVVSPSVLALLPASFVTFHLSITHSKKTAGAIVVIVGS